MYVGVEGESEHAMAYRDLIDAKFVPRTNLKRVDRERDVVQLGPMEAPGSASGQGHLERGELEASRGSGRSPADLALMPIDVRFSSMEDHSGIAYATTWWSGVGFESCALKELSPEEHLKQCAKLEREGFRPMGISAIEVPAKPGGPIERAQSRIVTASVWRRPLVSEDDKDRLAERKAVAAISLYLLGKPDPSQAAPRSSG